MNKPKLSEKKLLSVKFYRNLRRNFILWTTPLPPSPHPMVGSGYRLSNFWMAKGVNKEVKKKFYNKFHAICSHLKFQK
jgi:hypothetical protein